MGKKLYISVHTLVDFLLRTGDIDSRVFNNASMVEGTRIHLRYQKMQEGNYLSEEQLTGLIEFEDYEITLEGRADGIILGGDRVIIDEIKSTVAPLEEFYETQGEWHLGQAICYAYLYALNNVQDYMEVRLTYIAQHDDTKLFKSFVFSFDDLEKKVLGYIEEYLRFYRRQEMHYDLRNISAENLEFPYGEFRVGQREVSKYVYSVVKDGGEFFFEAPTGTGKTISTLFPAIKTFPEGKNEKIFYLSAKNQTKEVALNAIKTMIEKGLKVRSILISSKETMCQCDAKTCNPDECIFAKGYYSKLRRALLELLESDKIYDTESILDFAIKNEMCPFELQLDYSLLCDVIICDYNYLFDPLVHLKRYFDESNTPYFALIDEAHNLAERSLDMYSCELCEDDFLLLQKLFRSHKHPKFKRALKKLIKSFINFKTEDEEFNVIESDLNDGFIDVLEDFFKVSQDILRNYEEYISDQFITCFRAVNRFLKIYEYYNETYKIYFQNDNSTLYLKCLDASMFLKNTIKKIRGAIYFSATLTPMDYYINCLGGESESPTMKLPSPFPKKNLLLLVRGDVSTRYKDRSKSYQKIVDSITTLVKQKVGNYLVFFPSYQYLNDVLAIYPEGDNIIVQTKEMDRIQKDLFLNNFKKNPDKTTIGFAVLGGSFSEGIDLTYDKLIGAIIVGVGLPGLSFERNIMKEYYDSKDESGFDFAYTNPGMNKVMQAAGRVIRTKDDVGVVLLIDERFLSRKYQDLFKVEWSHYIDVYSEKEIEAYASRFWDNH